MSEQAHRRRRRLADRVSRRSVGTIGAAIPLAAAIGALDSVAPGAAAAAVAVVLLSALLVGVRSRLPGGDLSGYRFRWVSAAWAFLLIQPIGHFTTGRTTLTAVGGTPSIENVLELGSYGLIGAASLWSARRHRLEWRLSPLLFALPVLSVASTAWSLAPTVTLGFSFELVAIALLATTTAALLRRSPAEGLTVARRTLRITVIGVAALCCVGLVFRGGWVLPGEVPRFTWPGTHPLVASADVGLALLIVVFAGRRAAGFSGRTCCALVTLFVVCLYLGRARTALAGLVVAGLVGYWLLASPKTRGRRLGGAAVVLAGVAFAVATFSGPLTEYLYRGQSRQQVFALNGRLGLWTLALDQLHSPGRWLVGYGLSGTRVLLANSVAWAGDAHSAWVELLLSLGVLGAAVGVTVVATLAVRLWRTRRDGRLPVDVFAVIFVYAVAMSPAATGFAPPGPEPGLGFAMLALAYAVTAARAPVPVPSVACGTARAATGLTPAAA